MCACMRKNYFTQMKNDIKQREPPICFKLALASPTRLIPEGATHLLGLWLTQPELPVLEQEAEEAKSLLHLL